MYKINQFYCLAIDQGTFSTRGMLFDQRGDVVYSARQELDLKRLDHVHVEQDADALLNSVHVVIEKVFTQSGIPADRIKTAGLCTQRSSIVAWHSTSGQAISPVLSWQDTRAADWIAGFSGKSKLIHDKTGLRLTPYYGVSKMRWLMDQDKNVQQALKKDDCVITPLASYILFNISDNKCINIDGANASRTLLYNLLRHDWDEDLLQIFAIPRKILPHCRPIRYDYGTIKNGSTSISAVNGDQNAAMYSNGAPDSQALRVNLGTGAFVLTGASPGLLHSGSFRRSGLLAGIANNDAGSSEFYIEGTVNGAAAAILWLQHKLGIDDLRDTFPPRDYINPGRIIFINTIGGLGSPIWRNDLDSCFIDENNTMVEPGVKQSAIAVLESIIFLVFINIEQIIALKPSVRRIQISGGLSHVDYLCQALANLTRLNVERSVEGEATARGICWLALEHRQQWQALALEKEFMAEDDAGLVARFRHFRNYLSSL